MPVPPGSSLVFVAGQLSVDADGIALAVGDFEAQMRTVFANLDTVIRGSGGSLGGVIKMSTYLVDADHIGRFYEERARLFKTLYPDGVYPANTLLVVERLVRPEFLIEVEAVVAVAPAAAVLEEAHD